MTDTLDKKTKYTCEVVFSAGCNSNPNACAVALQAAGYEVARMKPEHYKLMAFEGDEFLEAMAVDTDADTFIQKVSIITEPFGGYCDNFGAIDDGYTPLQFLIDQEAKLATQS